MLMTSLNEYLIGIYIRNVNVFRAATLVLLYRSTDVVNMSFECDNLFHHYSEHGQDLVDLMECRNDQ